jgi:hypothetical protein
MEGGSHCIPLFVPLPAACACRCTIFVPSLLSPGAPPTTPPSLLHSYVIINIFRYLSPAVSFRHLQASARSICLSAFPSSRRVPVYVGPRLPPVKEGALPQSNSGFVLRPVSLYHVTVHTQVYCGDTV